MLHTNIDPFDHHGEESGIIRDLETRRRYDIIKMFAKVANGKTSTLKEMEKRLGTASRWAKKYGMTWRRRIDGYWQRAKQELRTTHIFLEKTH